MYLPKLRTLDKIDVSFDDDSSDEEKDFERLRLSKKCSKQRENTSSGVS